MSTQFRLSKSGVLTERCTITDPAGSPRYHVQGRYTRRSPAVMTDAAGVQVGSIMKLGLRTQYEHSAAG
jgi:uncharacterized protein YxjI